MCCRTAFFLLGLLGALITAPIASAIDATQAKLTLEPELWLLNGDQARYPEAPLTQPMAFPTMTASVLVSVMPEGAGADDFTALVLSESALVSSFVVNSTPGGARLLQINPVSRRDPFTKQLKVDLALGQGTLEASGAQLKGAVPVNLETLIILDEVDAMLPFFIAHVPSVRLGVEGTRSFTFGDFNLSIFVDATIFAEGWTTGTRTVSRRLITRRENSEYEGEPTGFQTFTGTAMGSRSARSLSVITPVVIEESWGIPDVPSPVRGFLRLSVDFVPEPDALILLAIGLAVGRKRRRGCHEHHARST